MNPNIRIHKDLVIESHQDLQHGKKQSITLNQSAGEMSNTELAARCEGEIKNFRLGKPSTHTYSLELLHRAIAQGDKEGRECIQRCFGELVLSWLRLHPKLRVISKQDKEEHYVAKTFEYFWQATTFMQHIEIDSLARVLQYLHASLNAVILDSQRAKLRSKAMPMQIPGQAEELQIEDNFENNDAWDTFKKLIPNGNEQRLAYLLFHCGLKPKQIKHYYPQEFSDEHEINRLRSSMIDRATLV